LLGAGDAGKSTFVRQMKVLHNDGFSTLEVEKFRAALQENTLFSMQKIVLHEELIPEPLKAVAQTVLDAVDLSTVADEIAKLWEDPAIKDAFEKRIAHGIHVPATAPYFFENVKRFVDPSWAPTNEDVFRAKMKTTGISETSFSEGGMQFVLIDVGGQRSERRKWLHCFDDITSIIYLAALDEYNMTLEEDNKTNRMEESVRLFAEVSSSSFFKPSCSWIVFLNKSDLLKEKIAKDPLSNYFTDISAADGADFDKCCEFIRKKYEEAFQGVGQLFVYITCALDTRNCKRVFTAVKDTVASSALSKAGFNC